MSLCTYHFARYCLTNANVMKMQKLQSVGYVSSHKTIHTRSLKHISIALALYQIYLPSFVLLTSTSRIKHVRQKSNPKIMVLETMRRPSARTYYGQSGQPKYGRCTTPIQKAGKGTRTLNRLITNQLRCRLRHSSISSVDSAGF